MQRTAWTDERLDDLARRMDDGFGRVDADIRDLRQTMEGRFDTIDRRFNALESRISWFGGGLLLTMFATILSNLL